MERLDIHITKEEISEAIEPWIIRKCPKRSLMWRRIQAKEAKRMSKKRIMRSIQHILSPSVTSTREHRTPAYVNERYSESWEGYQLPDPRDASEARKLIFLEWDEVGYVAPPMAAHRCHLLGICKALDLVRPSTVLEVGAGPGITLFALSSMYPEIEFAGVELTSAGVRTAVSLQRAPLPECIGDIAPMPVRSRTAHQRIVFSRGDAQALPFPDQSFDIVITRQAIEQMEQIHQSVFAEIHRVAKHHAVFVEPFPDFNKTLLQRIGTRTKNYITTSASSLGQHGFEPVFQFGDWPHKITNGVGMVMCRKLSRACSDGAGARFRPRQPA